MRTLDVSPLTCHRLQKPINNSKNKNKETEILSEHIGIVIETAHLFQSRNTTGNQKEEEQNKNQIWKD